MTFSREEERILSEDSIFLYDRYIQITREYTNDGNFPCRNIAVITALAATVGVCLDEMSEEGREEEALEIVMSMVLDVIEAIKK